MTARSSTKQMRKYRAEHPEYVAADRRKATARRRANARLRQLYPQDWERLYREELACGEDAS